MLQVRERPSERRARQFHSEAVKWLEKNIFRHHETLPDSPVGRLTEVASLCMLFVSAPADQRDLHVRDLGSGENASVLSFPQMREDQPLPVLRQRVHRAHALKDLPGSPGSSRRWTSA